MKVDLSVKESATINIVKAMVETEEELRSWWYSEISGISTWQRKIGVMATVMKVAKIWLLKMKMRGSRTKEIERIEGMMHELRVLSERGVEECPDKTLLQRKEGSKGEKQRRNRGKERGDKKTLASITSQPIYGRRYFASSREQTKVRSTR